MPPVRCIRNLSQPVHFVFIEYSTYYDAYRGSCATTVSTNFAFKMLSSVGKPDSQQTHTLFRATVAPNGVALITINGWTFRRAISSKLNTIIITFRWSCFRVTTQWVYRYY
ncbi:Uncharacterized protein FWK35_00007926 [Aphis craccivora]|uniref:Uncharacterized protein n=1 Tax=Aphis craccivora TaxID=307492 RepID=A0A6G0ZJE4_APHCR|nr:Uncharacterized protein FWK35_00007926 [Aphis craccivora]